MPLFQLQEAAELAGKTTDQAAALGLQAYLPVIFGFFMLVGAAIYAWGFWQVAKTNRSKDVDTAKAAAEAAKEFRASLKELAATLGGELRAERTAHTDKIVTMTLGLRDSISAFLAANASQIGSMVSGFAQTQRELIVALNQRHEDANEDRDKLLERTVAVLDSNAREIGRNSEALARLAPRTNGY